MYRPRFRWSVAASLMAIVALSLTVMALLGFSSQTHELSVAAQHQRDCALKSKDYSRLSQRVPGSVTAIVPHYNEQRHQCLVEIRSERTENGGKSLYDEIIDAENDHFIASRMQDIDKSGRPGDTVISGAPVRLDDKAGAESWFKGLLK
jgi:hypothetical protein